MDNHVFQPIVAKGFGNHCEQNKNKVVKIELFAYQFCEQNLQLRLSYAIKCFYLINRCCLDPHNSWADEKSNSLKFCRDGARKLSCGLFLQAIRQGIFLSPHPSA
jgi:hypothetical protein